MMRQQWSPALFLALFLAPYLVVFGAVCAAALAGTAGGGQDADAITVTSDQQLRETTYTGVSGPCRIDWIVSGSEINRGGSSFGIRDGDRGPAERRGKRT
jgi:hypothetical protein